MKIEKKKHYEEYNKQVFPDRAYYFDVIDESTGKGPVAELNAVDYIQMAMILAPIQKIYWIYFKYKGNSIYWSTEQVAVKCSKLTCFYQIQRMKCSFVLVVTKRICDGCKIVNAIAVCLHELHEEWLINTLLWYIFLSSLQCYSAI